MKRDLDLMRNILLRIEEKPEVPPRLLGVEDFLDFCDNPHIVSIHIGLLADAGFIEVMDGSYNSNVRDYDVVRLTFAGYEYLDAVRNARVWKNVKDKISSFGGVALDIVKEVATEQIKKELNLS